jgi:hypothetical protein
METPKDYTPKDNTEKNNLIATKKRNLLLSNKHTKQKPIT